MSTTSTAAQMLRFPYDSAIGLDEVPEVGIDAFRQVFIDDMNAGASLHAFFGYPDEHGGVRLMAVLGHREEASLAVITTTVRDCYPSLTADCPQTHWFEREIAEQWGVVPVGHPWLKPLRFHASYRPGHDAWGRTSASTILPTVQPEGTPYYRVEGTEIHEVAVGPVHAGIIEPGHFRFQCHGEHVFHLEVVLGYQHRGIEKLLRNGPNKRTLPLIEGLSGDTTVGHAMAHTQMVESLMGVYPSFRANSIRAIALELERLANHTGDVGAIAGDVGYLPTLSYCGRLRGDFLNSTALLCGNRFGRSLVRPGGVAHDLNPDLIDEITAKVDAALKDVAGATTLLFNSPSVEARFDETGRVSYEDASALGLVGMAARACGIDRDIRLDFPSGAYRFHYIPISTVKTGDVFARASVRNLEIQRSGKFVLDELRALPAGSIQQPTRKMKPNALAVGLSEAWRGEVCHVALTNADGGFLHYKVVDPSFHNWVGMMIALRDQSISDFPLCNKSFNLSYCGHDL